MDDDDVIIEDELESDEAFTTEHSSTFYYRILYAFVHKSFDCTILFWLVCLVKIHGFYGRLWALYVGLSWLCIDCGENRQLQSTEQLHQKVR